MTEFVLTQNLFRFYHPEVDGADKYLWMDEMERLSNKMVNEVQCCQVQNNAQQEKLLQLSVQVRAKLVTADFPENTTLMLGRSKKYQSNQSTEMSVRNYEGNGKKRAGNTINSVSRSGLCPCFLSTI